MAVVKQENEMNAPAVVEEKQARVPVSFGAKGVEVRSLDELVRFAHYVVRSGFAPKGVDSLESAVVAIQMGLEIGLSPLQAIQNIAVINGRPSVWGDAVKGLVLATGACEDFREWFEGEGEKMVAHCAIKRRGMSEVVRSFSWAEAKLAELSTKSGPWKQYPKRMLQMRARSWACRDAFPDALKGLYVAEEAHDMSPRDAIDVTPERPKREVVTIDPEQIINGEPPEDPKATADSSPQPIDPEQERKDLIASVMQRLADLPAKEIRDEMISTVRKETGSKNNEWIKWETAAIQTLEAALMKE